MSIIANTPPTGGTHLARFAGALEGDLFDAIVPVRDTHGALTGDAQTLDHARDHLLRNVAVGMRELMETESSPYRIRQALREWMPMLERANVLDKHIDEVAFCQAPVSLTQAHEALLAGVGRCERALTGGDS